jgi:formylglycine-generating enzyme required for sulfatase activity
LPTEAEWEYACRGGVRTYSVFHYGNSLSSKQANFNGKRPYGAAKGPSPGRPTPVGSYGPNAFGLYDMHGNVWEWCSDWYGERYYAESPAEDPAGPKAGDSRVLRGGCWYWHGSDCRSAYRSPVSPDYRNYCVGFRVALAWGR